MLASGGWGVGRLGGVRGAGIGGGGGAPGGDGAVMGGGGRDVVVCGRGVDSDGRAASTDAGDGLLGRVGATECGGGGAAEGFRELIGGGGGFSVLGSGGGGALGGVISVDALLDRSGISEFGRWRGFRDGLRRWAINGFDGCKGDDSVVWGVGLKDFGLGTIGGFATDKMGGLGAEVRDVSGSER